jgi:hypothetical protein
MSKSAHTVTAGLLMAALLAGASGSSAAAYDEVTVYVDGQQVDFVSKIRGGRLPALLVEGHPMVAARFLEEALGHPLDLHMWSWGVVRIGNLSFKVGCDYALSPVPMIGGTLGMRVELPLSPRTINGRLYLPAVEPIRRLHRYEERGGKQWLVSHEVAWDAEVKALRLTTVERELGGD